MDQLQQNNYFEEVMDLRHEAEIEAEKALKGKKILTFRAVYGKQQGAYTARPRKSELTGGYLGVQNLTDEQKRKQIKVVEPDTSFEVRDGVQLNLENPLHALTWAWLMFSPRIAFGFEHSQKQPTAMFYIEDLEKQIDKKLLRRDQIIEANNWLKELSHTRKLEVIRLLGQRAEGFTPGAINEKLSDDAFENPEKILNIRDDKNYKARVFFYKLVDKGLIAMKEGDGVYRAKNDASVNLGSTEGQVLHFLDDVKNRDFVQVLYRMVYPMEKTHAAGGLLNELAREDAKGVSVPEKEAAVAAAATELEDVRQEYREVFGQEPNNRAGVANLRERIDIEIARREKEEKEAQE